MWMDGAPWCIRSIQYTFVSIHIIYLYEISHCIGKTFRFSSCPSKDVFFRTQWLKLLRSMRFMLQALSFSPGYDSALESELASCVTVMYCLQLNVAWLKGLICSYHPVKWRWSLRWLQTQLLLYSKLPSTIQSKHTFFDVEWSTAYHFFWPRLGDIFSKTSKAQYSQCGWGCPGPFDDPAECGVGWGWGRRAVLALFGTIKKTIRFLHVIMMWWWLNLLKSSFHKETLCVLSLLSLLVSAFRYSFATSLQTSVMCMAIMLSLTFGDCRSLLMSHEALHTSMFS